MSLKKTAAAITGSAVIAIGYNTNMLKTSSITANAEGNLIGSFELDQRPVLRSGGESRPALADEGPMPDLGGAVGWLNSAPLNRKSLRGKVLLINFWTYTCINSLRPMPYLRTWAANFKDAGLVVIGVHTPEFSFEHELTNVENAVHTLKVTFPVAVDSNYRIWRAFQNEAWPAQYLVDAKGRIRYHHFGEDSYGEIEHAIELLLEENGATGLASDTTSVSGVGIEAAPDWTDARSPETYIGYRQTENFASPGGTKSNKRHDYTAPTRLKLNHWALSGSWTIGPESVALNNAGGRIVYHFHARDLHLVMGPAVPGTPVRFRVRIDSEPPGSAHGVDVDEQGNGTVTEPRMYQLIRQGKPIVDRQFEIEFLDSGVEAFSFTFG